MIYRVIKEFIIDERRYLPGEFVDDMKKKKLEDLIKKGFVVKRKKVQDAKNT